ncbi:MAG: hypothetical protein II858_01425 [Bacteroidales bacterium]|nr:hypothetical protein [Bacteroidales bacterium]
MNRNKSILMPHTCQKIGWYLLVLSLVLLIVKALFVHTIDVAWYFAKTTHIGVLVSLFLISLSKEKVEDEMISAYRLKAIGITAYVFYSLLIILSLVLELKPNFIFSNTDTTLSAYICELFLIILPILLSVLYYTLFRGLLWKSKKQ